MLSRPRRCDRCLKPKAKAVGLLNNTLIKSGLPASALLERTCVTTPHPRQQHVRVAESVHIIILAVLGRPQGTRCRRRFLRRPDIMGDILQTSRCSRLLTIAVDGCGGDSIAGSGGPGWHQDPPSCPGSSQITVSSHVALLSAATRRIIGLPGAAYYRYMHR